MANTQKLLVGWVVAVRSITSLTSCAWDLIFIVAFGFWKKREEDG
jgi:hypothetical protein